jgi:two-component system LytT family response regulator
MINCIIIDDEETARNLLEATLNRFFADKIKVICKATSLKEGVFAIYNHNPDLVFVDIEMKEENGFNIFNYFQQVNFSVIFTTSFKESATKAFRLAALDYITKPVKIDDLRMTIELYEKRHSTERTIERIEKTIKTINPSNSVIEKKVALPTLGGFQLVKTNAIVYCQADQNYTKVFTLSGEELLVSKLLNFVEELLPIDIFYRIHKSYIVNLNFVKAYSRAEGFHISLENGVKLPVATRRNEDFVKVLTQR